MFLKERKSGHLIEVLDLESLIDPNVDRFRGRYNYGEDLPDPQDFAKADVVFPSGEPLPRCWVDVHYRDDELRH
ncbi:MAG: acetyltransferase [Gammaproteobacteria bacterium]|nr:MAG: acetyltransferase [Gammaproteobacteria bacterium]